MVNPWIRKRMVVGSCVLLICGVAWVLWPHMVICTSDPYMALIRQALMACQRETNLFPKSFVEVEPFLEMSTRTDCRITQTGEKQYYLEMPVSSGRTYYFDITYAVDSHGELEKYDVHIIGSKRTR